MNRLVSLAGIEPEIAERGDGPPLLFLEAGEGVAPNRDWLDRLARHFRVIAPVHPGWGERDLPDWMGGIDDLAYFYLDLAAALELRDAVLAGAGFGGWIAAEMAVRNTQRFARMVLAAPLGIKLGGVLDRDILDMHALDPDALAERAWADPGRGKVDFTQLNDATLAKVARGRESLLVFGWKPYMHNPRLHRWLHRARLPTLLLWGERDRVVRPEYGEGWRRCLPDARLELIADAGHFPHWEQPDAFAARIAAFAGR